MKSEKLSIMFSKKIKRITVLGAGSWGIALALHCHRMGHNVTLWEFDVKEAGILSQVRRREDRLPGIRISDKIEITHDLGLAVAECEYIILAVPSHVARSVLSELAQFPVQQKVLISCIKGIENDTLMRISEIAADVFSANLANFVVLSGPSHAEEVSKGIPTAVVVASKNTQIAEKVQKSLTNKRFRFYRSDDVVGVELGGALKNVIAIAAGICDGAGFGDNTKAALQPRGLAEISRLGTRLGANPLTFGGLSGMGDLIVTCMSRHSRNRFVGEEIGKGKSLDKVLEEIKMVAEGVKTCQAAVKLAKKHHVEMPISEQIYQVLFHCKSPRKAVEALMSRELKPEVW
jgi:glycerol-3-phosphate dehydrogenase (NAD(P)+)